MLNTLRTRIHRLLCAIDSHDWITFADRGRPVLAYARVCLRCQRCEGLCKDGRWRELGSLHRRWEGATPSPTPALPGEESP